MFCIFSETSVLELLNFVLDVFALAKLLKMPSHPHVSHLQTKHQVTYKVNFPSRRMHISRWNISIKVTLKSLKVSIMFNMYSSMYVQCIISLIRWGYVSGSQNLIVHAGVHFMKVHDMGLILSFASCTTCITPLSKLKLKQASWSYSPLEKYYIKAGCMQHLFPLSQSFFRS